VTCLQSGRVRVSRAIVADSFHIKPLLRVLQSADRFEVLVITREHVRLFHGNRYALDEVELDAAVPRSLTDALSSDELRARAWEIVGPAFVARLQLLLDDFHAAHPRALASDDLAELAIRMGGDVVVVPTDKMPSVTGVAAIYRF
jgi:hypothetical protein